MNFHQITLDFLRRRKHAYNLVLHHNTAEHNLLMKDLARFCRAFESCYVPGDHDATMVLIGRNEVWQRIHQHLNMSVEDLYKRFGGPNMPEEKN